MSYVRKRQYTLGEPPPEAQAIIDQYMDIDKQFQALYNECIADSKAIWNVAHTYGNSVTNQLNAFSSAEVGLASRWNAWIDTDPTQVGYIEDAQAMLDEYTKSLADLQNFYNTIHQQVQDPAALAALDKQVAAPGLLDIGNALGLPSAAGIEGVLKWVVIAGVAYLGITIVLPMIKKRGDKKSGSKPTAED